MEVRGVKNSNTGELIVPNWNYLDDNGKELPIMPDTLQDYYSQYSDSLFMNFRANEFIVIGERKPESIHEVMFSKYPFIKKMDHIYLIAKHILESVTDNKFDRHSRKFIATSIINLVLYVSGSESYNQYCYDCECTKDNCIALDKLIVFNMASIH